MSILLLFSVYGLQPLGFDDELMIWDLLLSYVFLVFIACSHLNLMMILGVWTCDYCFSTYVMSFYALVIWICIMFGECLLHMILICMNGFLNFDGQLTLLIIRGY